MANRPAFVKQADATRLFKAAKAAGYDRPRFRFVQWPDGRSEFIVEPIGRDEPAMPGNEWDEVLE